MNLPLRPYKTASLRAWVKASVAIGAARWRLHQQLAGISLESLELFEMKALTSAMSSIEDVVVDRNLKGIDLEKQGKLSQAITLYEKNIADAFDGSHPYNRLRIAYSEREDATNLLRVYEAYKNLHNPEQKLCDQFRRAIDRLQPTKVEIDTQQPPIPHRDA